MDTVRHPFKPPSAYPTGFWLLIIVLFLIHVPAHSEWVAVEKDYVLPGFQALYVEPETIRREGNLVTVWQLLDFRWMQGSARGPTRFSSTKTHKQFDCTEKRLRLLAFTEFSHQMGNGRSTDGYVDKEKWLPVEQDSINYALWELVCGKE